MLRYLAHSGHRQSGQHGGLGRRAHEEVRLSEVHHPHRGGPGRYWGVQQEKKPFPSLILIDGGLGQLRAAVEALDALGVINQPVASIAKREEIIYVYGQEDEPIKLDRYSPVLHVIQQVRDEAHRFAVTFHRTRRGAARLTSELEQVEGIGAKTISKLLREFGSLERVREASADELAKVIGPAAARRLRDFYNLAAAAELKVLN